MVNEQIVETELDSLVHLAEILLWSNRYEAILSVATISLVACIMSLMTF